MVLKTPPLPRTYRKVDARNPDVTESHSHSNSIPISKSEYHTVKIRKIYDFPLVL